MSRAAPQAPTRAQSINTGSALPSRQSFRSSQGMAGVPKAVYRPMVTVAKHRSVSRMSGSSTEPPPLGRHSTLNQDRLSTINEDRLDTDSIMTVLTNDIPKPRYVYQPPSDEYAAREMKTITDYMADTHVSDHMQALCQGLLSEVNLPYNPYPAFLKKMCHLPEGFHMYAETNENIRAKLLSPVQKTSSPIIWGVKGQTNVWGLKDIVQVVDPQSIKNQAWLLSTVLPLRLAEMEGSSVKGNMLLALTGPAVFSGTFYKEYPSVDFILEFMLYGTNIDMALQVFAMTLREDVKRTVSSKSPHQCLGISLHTADNKEVLWDRKRIESEKDEFCTSVAVATKQRRPPVMKCVFATDGDMKTFKRGTKKYVFHFIETDDDTGVERFTSFSEHPFATLFSSIFLRKADAEAYVAAFKRQHGSPTRATTTQATTRDGGTSRAGRGRRQEQPQRHTNVEALGENVKVVIRNDMERELARLSFLNGESSRIFHLLLLIILMDRNLYKLEHLVDIYRFFRSTSHIFHTVSSVNLYLRTYIRQYDDSHQEFALKLFLQYKHCLLHTLDHSLHERSSEYEAVHRFLKRQLDRVTETQTRADGSTTTILPFRLQTVFQLLQLEHYCHTVQLALTEEALTFVKHFDLKEYIVQLRNKFPEEVPKLKTRVKAIPESSTKKKTTKGQPIKTQPMIFKHGVETLSIIQQKNLVVNVQWSVQTSMHPVVMATEGVLMQYLIDVKLDQVWKGFLMELMMAESLPPNPYPRLITRLRQAACKMELWRETDQQLRSRTMHGMVRPADRTNHVSVLEECDGYGLSSAMAGVQATSLKKLSVMIEMMTNHSMASHRGEFQLSSGLAISGHSPLYGQMMPYLPFLELHEHYYIRGPMGRDHSAIDLFAKLVYDHIADLCSSEKYVITGLYVNDQLALNQDKLEEDQQGAESVIVKAANQKSALYLKVYTAIGWRYVAIHKYYMMHYLFVDHAEDKHVAYFQDDPIFLYQNVFLSLEEAINHYQQSGVSVMGNPLGATNVAVINKSIDQSVLGRLRDQDLIGVHKLLMTKSLINKNAEYFADTWRMLHSVAFKFEYIFALTNSLCDVIRYVLQHPNAMETVEYTESVEAAKAKAKKGVTIPVKKFPVKESTLGNMSTAYLEKVQEVLNEPGSLVPQSLPRVIGDKLREVVEKHPQTGDQTIVIEKQSNLKLKEILDLLLPVKVAIEHDVHQACNKVQETLKQLAGT
ncbi:uncharacterized protein [Diadema antillarum]|uniref:uncharacterized protein n=1 Tax=Diadema antillarum TaxID=105358 RepID=UPI003A83EA53